MKKTIILSISLLVIIVIVIGIIVFANNNNLQTEKQTTNNKESLKNDDSEIGKADMDNANEENTTNNDKKILIAFFSKAGENYSVGKVEVGNTELMAKNIAKITGGDLYKIEPIVDYPDSYEEAKEVATVEQSQNSRPKIKSKVENFDDYDTIFIGYPIWYGDCPMIIYTFLESYDFSGKTVIPFNTHEGSGDSGTYEKIKNKLPNSTVLEGLAIRGSDARQESSKSTIEEWIQKTISNNVENTPVSLHGKLKVSGTSIVDEKGNNFQLKGVSTHGLQWYPQYVNQETFIYMRDQWGINAIRLAMYSDPNVGYTPELHKIVDNGVEYAKNSGLYVIIDWHILSDGNPNTNKENAISFFKEMATKYKDYNNVLYEICNEPNGNVEWERDIKPYAQELIKEIRSIDKDSIIIVGTPNWSQDVDIVAKSPITEYDNIMYSLHFYAATHKDYLRQKATVALNSNLPLFVSEFGICDASGNGNLDIEEANIWIDFLNQNNISWICWNLSNKNESSALLKNTEKITSWINDELSDEGKWLLEALKR